MATGALGTALEHLRGLFNGGTAVGQTDGQLLLRYAVSHDGPAFEALVARHGPMVLATCRAVLKHEHDVEDAFQATFLVLARKAGAIRAGDTLGGWIHQVAYRVAMQLNIELKRRHLRESEVLAMATPFVNCPEPELDSDLGSILHEEISRLPEVERVPVVLCDLEGLTYEQAAYCLNWTVPALGCRLSKARKRLRDRLTRRGVTATALGVLTAVQHGIGSPSRLVTDGRRGRNQWVDIGGRGRADPDCHQRHAHRQGKNCRDGRAGGGHPRIGRSRRHGRGRIRQS